MAFHLQVPSQDMLPFTTLVETIPWARGSGILSMPPHVQTERDQHLNKEIENGNVNLLFLIFLDLRFYFCRLSRGSRKLKLTACDEDQFTCDSGACIDMEGRY